MAEDVLIAETRKVAARQWALKRAVELHRLNSFSNAKKVVVDAAIFTRFLLAGDAPPGEKPKSVFEDVLADAGFAERDDHIPARPARFHPVIALTKDTMELSFHLHDGEVLRVSLDLASVRKLREALLCPR
jgi:hypothetical protein